MGEWLLPTDSYLRGFQACVMGRQENLMALDRTTVSPTGGGSRVTTTGWR
jgi:hypothetical protein